MDPTYPSPTTQPLAPARAHLIEGRPLRIFDGYLPDAGLYMAALANAAFTRTEMATPATADFRHWVAETRLESLAKQPIFGLTQRAVSGFADGGVVYRPYRAYTNMSSYGDMLFTHTDCLPGQRDLTALWYLCERWDVEWGGETMFYDAHDEVAVAVLPKPGRLVVFDGAIKHAGRPPNRICHVPRYTFAIKFERLDASHN